MNWIEAIEPGLAGGGVTVDDRGTLTFCNDIDLTGVRRFYTITNHVVGRVRAWHGHRAERKLMWPLSGAMLVGLVRIDNWSTPSRASEVKRVVLSAHTPQFLVVPPGFANGTMSLTSDAALLVLSTLALGDSMHDDVRFDARYWDPWQVKER
jgi:dTDP-4-dehydrorhamnose 3,5-epimerase-like enzyme